MLKILACFFMLIDHIGIIFLPGCEILRILGRISMPLYAYSIARGIKYTRNIKKYSKRILEVSLIAQIPYCIMEKEIKLNICFLWLIGIWCITTVNKQIKRFNKIMIIIFSVICVSMLNVDYGVYGLLYLIITYYSLIAKENNKNKDIYMYVSWSILHIFKIIFDIYSGIMQIFTLPSIALIDISNKYGMEDKKINNIFIQFFYPIHMIILLFIYNIS